MTGNELIPNPQDRIICVKVGKVKRESFYEMARKYWVVKLERASKATYVLAIVNGIVDTVYIPEKWMHSKDQGKEHRCEFIGTEVPTSEYIGKSVTHLYGKSQNPVKYINM
jgi:hypothetical protein